MAKIKWELAPDEVMWESRAATVWQYGSGAATAGQYESWPEVITGAGVSNKLPPIVPFSEAASYNSHTAAPWCCVIPLHGRSFELKYTAWRTFVWG